MEYTLAGAAEATGVAKTTIFRAIKSGKLSARRLDDKTFRIDGAELARVYSIKGGERSSEERRNVPQQGAEARKPAPARASETELAVLKVRLEAAQAEATRERQERERDREAMEREREAWERERNAIKLIESQFSRERDELQKRLEEERQERREAQQQLMERAQEQPVAAPPPEQEVESLRKRVEEAEGRMTAAVEALGRVQERAAEVADRAKPAKPSRGFLARLLGRG